jgi:hypothetical protein
MKKLFRKLFLPKQEQKQIDCWTVSSLRETIDNLKATSDRQRAELHLVHLLSDAHAGFVLKVLHLCATIDFTDCLWWRTDGAYAPVTFFVSCSDKFATSCADHEELTPSNVDVFEKAIADCLAIETRDDTSFARFHAPLLFCARVRGERPLKYAYSKYGSSVVALFEQCGPPR